MEVWLSSLASFFPTIPRSRYDDHRTLVLDPLVRVTTGRASLAWDAVQALGG